MFDKLHEECGVFGISLSKDSPDLVHQLYLGLFALQHRGQESCGVAYYQNDKIEMVKTRGLVAGSLFELLPTDHVTANGIGHVRYSTCGGSSVQNAQPFTFHCNKGDIAIAHNGNIPNSEKLKSELIQTGSIFQTTSDTEILVHLISRIPGTDFDEALISSLNHLKGAYSMLMLHNNRLIAFRDPSGFRPLSYGEVDNGYAFASETCALDLLGAKNIQEVLPGELVICNKGKLEKKQYTLTKKVSQCVFELIYFSRPDSIIFGESVYQARLKMGSKLAKQIKSKHDIVISVPDSGNSAALGFSRESDIRFDFGLMRNHYTGRTFIKPGQNNRESGVKIKLNPVPSIIRDKNVAVIDDSLVRGTTSKRIIKMLKDAGAREVHLYLSSPEIKHSCFFGIDTPTEDELISSLNTPEKIAQIIGAESVTFLSINDLKSCLEKPENYCYACFDGKYPIKIDENCKRCTP